MCQKKVATHLSSMPTPQRNHPQSPPPRLQRSGAAHALDPERPPPPSAQHPPPPSSSAGVPPHPRLLLLAATPRRHFTCCVRARRARPPPCPPLSQENHLPAAHLPLPPPPLGHPPPPILPLPSDESAGSWRILRDAPPPRSSHPRLATCPGCNRLSRQVPPPVPARRRA
ncbi:hypothetical protein VPH35_012987 [Triticum aestivum]